MPFLNRVDWTIWWLTVSKTADRSSNISNEDLEAVLASLRSSTTESKAVSVECPLLKPDWLLSRRLFCVRKAVTWLNTTNQCVSFLKRIWLQWCGCLHECCNSVTYSSKVRSYHVYLYTLVLYATDCLNSCSFTVLNMKNHSQCRFQLELQRVFLL